MKSVILRKTRRFFEERCVRTCRSPYAASTAKMRMAGENRIECAASTVMTGATKLNKNHTSSVVSNFDAEWV